MRTIIISIHLLLVFSFAFSQNVITPNGSGAAWNDPANWSGSNIADNVNEDVDFSGNNRGEVVVQNGDTYTVGNTDLRQGNELTIESGGILSIGLIFPRKNLTTDNNTVINVYGNLTVWGDLTVNNNLELNVTGSLIIWGDLTLNNNSAIDISGTAIVTGNLNGGQNTDVNVDGTLGIGGNINVGNNSDLTGSGDVIMGGGCTDDGSGDFCNSGPLPVELLHFKAITSQDDVELLWATTSELNNDHFTLERSRNGMGFEIIAQVDGHGTIAERMNYEYIDTNPHLGISYYRLSQTDYDSTTEVFPIISVLFNPGKSIFTISPNPIENQSITLRATGNKENELVELNILDLNGKLIDNNYLHADQFGNIETDIQLRNQLKKGIYIFKLISESRKTSSKIIVE